MVHLFVCRRGIDFEVMAFELAYRLTFIDAVEAPAVGALPRSRSLPVLGSVPTADEEVQYQAPRLDGFRTWGSFRESESHHHHEVSKDLKGSCRTPYMRGPVVENASQTMESDMVNYFKRYRDLMVKLKGAVVFLSHLGLYSNLTRIA